MIDRSCVNRNSSYVKFMGLSIETADGLVLVGINTITEGFGGRFGDIGGGVLLDPANLAWILTTTGIPEPAAALLVIWTIPYWLCRRTGLMTDRL